MFKFLNKRRQKGQSTLEYAILIIIILGALLAIQVYIKRGIQGRLKESADNIGDQFSPGNTNAVRTTSTVGQTSDSFAAGTTRTQVLRTEVHTELQSMNVLNIQQEYWGN